MIYKQCGTLMTIDTYRYILKSAESLEKYKRIFEVLERCYAIVEFRLGISLAF